MIMLSQRKRKKALLKNSPNLEQIWNDYYSLKEFNNVVFERQYVVKRHTYRVREILSKYHLESVIELFFLLHRHGGKPVKDCKFCGHLNTSIKNRSGKDHIDICHCRGICTLCKKPYNVANEDGVCYTCKPYYHPERCLSDDPDDIRYRFLRCTGNHEYMENIQTVEEAEKMMDVAKYYYEVFLRIANGLANRDNSGGTSGADVAG